MTINIRPTYKLLTGDIRELTEEIGEVSCIVTSVPYFHQRKYGDSDLEVGREADVVTYIDGLVSIFSALHVHKLGSIWVNISDKRRNGALLNIPARFSQSMIEAGFRLVDEVIWAKAAVREDGSTVGHCMTEKCLQRINGNAHEYLYRFTLSKDAWCDAMAVQIPRSNVESIRYLPSDLMSCETAINGRSPPNVWQIGQGQTHEHHYAVYPTTLVERPIAMACPLFVNPDGSLPRRHVEWIEYDEGRKGSRAIGKVDPCASVEKKGRHDNARQYIPRMPVSVGWDSVMDGARAGVVLDPFCGTSTTGAVALKLGRSYIGVDLYAENVEISQRRCSQAMSYVDANYGYDKVYEMIMVNQQGQKANLTSERSNGKIEQAQVPVRDLDELFTFEGGA
jgi:DNA modification methylase